MGCGCCQMRNTPTPSGVSRPSGPTSLGHLASRYPCCLAVSYARGRIFLYHAGCTPADRAAPTGQSAPRATNASQDGIYRSSYSSPGLFLVAAWTRRSSPPWRTRKEPRGAPVPEPARLCSRRNQSPRHSARIGSNELRRPRVRRTQTADELAPSRARTQS